MQELNLLQKKLNGLIKAYSALQAEGEQLRKINEKQRKEIEKQEKAIRNLEEQLQWSATGKAINMLDDEKKEFLKQQLDKALLELEKNIALLK
jgi:hypothetical protein